MYRLLIVEDDKGRAEAIKTQAELWDLQVHCIENFRNIMTEFAEFDPHIILLDIALPFFNGYHWCNEIRKVSKVPIILAPRRILCKRISTNSRISRYQCA